MYLSKFTDYSFRILIFLGHHPNELFTVDQLSGILNLSTHHIKKVIYNLAKNQYIDSAKGRNGGIKLTMDPHNINLGKILEITEENLNIFECFNSESNTCSLNGICRLKSVVNDALNSFKSEFYKYNLDDIL